jgi:hypothetical protein
MKVSYGLIQLLRNWRNGNRGERCGRCGLTLDGKDL